MKGTAPYINFLKIQKKVQKQQTKKRRAMFKIGYILVGLYGLGLVGLWGFSIYLGIAINNTESKISQEKQKIASLRNVEAKYLTIIDKLKTIETISSTGIPFHTLSETMFQLIPEGMEISGFDIDEQGIISFGAKTSSILILEQYSHNLEQMKNQGTVDVEKSTVSHLTIDENGACSFSNILKLRVKS